MFKRLLFLSCFYASVGTMTYAMDRERAERAAFYEEVERIEGVLSHRDPNDAYDADQDKDDLEYVRKLIAQTNSGKEESTESLQCKLHRKEFLFLYNVTLVCRYVGAPLQQKVPEELEELKALTRRLAANNRQYRKAYVADDSFRIELLQDSLEIFRTLIEIAKNKQAFGEDCQKVFEQSYQGAAADFNELKDLHQQVEKEKKA